MINALTGQPFNSDDLYVRIAKDKAALAHTPSRELSFRVNAILRLQGYAETMETLNNDTAGLGKFAAEQNWGPERLLLAQLQIVARASLRNTEDDSAAYTAGAREFLKDAYTSLNTQIADLYRGQDAK